MPRTYVNDVPRDFHPAGLEADILALLEWGAREHDDAGEEGLRELPTRQTDGDTGESTNRDDVPDICVVRAAAGGRARMSQIILLF